MLSHKYKCIFVHIPKCGGSSIEKILWPSEAERTASNLWRGFISKYHNKYQTGGLQHLQASQIKLELTKEVFNTYFKCSIVRNPWDKAVSQFEYMKKRKDLRDYIGMSENDSFKKYLSLIQRNIHVQWDVQHKFIVDNNEKLMVDFVGKFESFESDVSKILGKLKIVGIDKIPHVNKSIRSHYKDYYDSESREIIQYLYKKDIELFGYKF